MAEDELLKNFRGSAHVENGRPEMQSRLDCIHWFGTPAKALRLSINLDDYVISKEAFERLQKGIAMIQEAMGEAHHAIQ